MRFLSFRPWTLTDVDPPWDEESLYGILKVNGPKAALSERPRRDENELGWVPGALDGVMGHHFNRADDDETQKRTNSILGALARFYRTAKFSTYSL